MQHFYWRFFSGIIYCIILKYVNFIFFTFIVNSTLLNLKCFNLRNNSSGLFPISLNAGFGCQRPSIMPEILTEILNYRTVIKVFTPLSGHFQLTSTLGKVFILLQIHIYILFVLRTLLCLVKYNVNI